jgi:drug/metabolite transporter (DMT)-like permease
MLIGILSALAAGALWGLAFIAPAAVAPFTPVDLTVARYLVLGVMSLALLQGYRAVDALGYTAYYVPTAFATTLAGPTVTTLIIGLLPLTLGLIGNWSDRTIAWSKLALPLALSLIGIFVVNVEALSNLVLPADRTRFALGVGLAFIGLGVWVMYAVWNAAALRRAPVPVSAKLWTSLQGVGAAVSCLPIIAFMAYFGGSHFPQARFDTPETLRFMIWALVMGTAASWFANLFWTVAAKRLSVALTGQLIVSETLFGLFFAFIYARRAPTLLEGVGAAIMILGVILAVRAFNAARLSDADKEGTVR